MRRCLRRRRTLGLKDSCSYLMCLESVRYFMKLLTRGTAFWGYFWIHFNETSAGLLPRSAKERNLLNHSESLYCMSCKLFRICCDLPCQDSDLVWLTTQSVELTILFEVEVTKSYCSLHCRDIVPTHIYLYRNSNSMVRRRLQTVKANKGTPGKRKCSEMKNNAFTVGSRKRK